MTIPTFRGGGVSLQTKVCTLRLPVLTLSSDDFMRFFINKIVSIREKINGILPTIITDGYIYIGIIGNYSLSLVHFFL